jgi:hypothetical protein
VLCFVGFAGSLNRGFSIRNSGVDEEAGGMSGCKGAGGTPSRLGTSRRYGTAGEALGRAGSGAALLVNRPSHCANFCGRP